MMEACIHIKFWIMMEYQLPMAIIDTNGIQMTVVNIGLQNYQRHIFNTATIEKDGQIIVERRKLHLFIYFILCMVRL